MLPAGLAHVVGAEFAGSNFVLAVRNTFLTVEEPPRLVRRNSWPADLDTAEAWDASGFEGDLEGDDSDWEEEEEAEEFAHKELVSKEEAADSSSKMKWLAANRPNYKPDHVAALSEHIAALTDDSRREDADEDTSANDREAHNTERKYRASRLAVKSDFTSGFTTDDKEAGEDLADMSTATSTPPAPVVTGPPSGIAFQEEVLRVAEEVAQMLSQLDYAPVTEATMTNRTTDEGVCTITATLQKEHQESMKHLLTTAKDEIFKRTSRSRGVCLLGYKKTPFTMTPDGFTTKLGTVSPKRQVCKQFYAEGRCKYMEDCYWQHPQSICTMTFVVEIKMQ